MKTIKIHRITYHFEEFSIRINETCSLPHGHVYDGRSIHRLVLQLIPVSKLHSYINLFTPDGELIRVKMFLSTYELAKQLGWSEDEND